MQMQKEILAKNNPVVGITLYLHRISGNYLNELRPYLKLYV